MSLHGVLSHVEGLGDKLQIEFYSDPAQAAFKALTEG